MIASRIAPLLLALVVFAAPVAAEQAHVAPQTNPSPERPRRIVLDVDPGIDDAMAMLLALRSPELRIEAITVVSGNVLVDQGAQNALKLVELAGRPEIPVAQGARYPLLRKLITAESIHGPEGLGEAELPAPSKKLDARHAVDVIVELVNAAPGEITLVPVGPLTNIALAFRKDPTLVDKIPEIILMGGSIVGGNATPAAEANIYNDPEAAAVVFGSGVPITMADLGATAQARLTREHLARLEASASPVARFVARMGDFYIGFGEKLGFFGGADLHDPLAVGLAIDKTLASELRPMHVVVETRGEHTYGETVANRYLLTEGIEDAGDHYAITHFPRVAPNADVPVVVDGERFVELFLERLGAAPRESSADHPARWRQAVPERLWWEIAPHEAAPGELVLSKRNELGILSNFAATPFYFRGKRYASVEGLWYSLAHPEGPDDPRLDGRVEWNHTRDEVARMVGFDAKAAGALAEANMAALGIDWVSFEGRRLPYWSREKGEHYALVRQALWEKLRQHAEIERLLLSTGSLRLIPDNFDSLRGLPAWRYFEIYGEIREALRSGGPQPPSARYPERWWQPVPEAEKQWWEILPQAAGPGEVILSKRNELGIFSNFAPTAFELRGERYASVEGLWQSLLYPEGPDDPRATFPGLTWAHTRDEVAAMTAFDAKAAGDLAEENMKKLGIDWVSFEGERMTYRTPERGEHYALILAAMRAKLEQNPEVGRLLLATGDLVLSPDHHQEPGAPPAWRYFEIWMELREELEAKNPDTLRLVRSDGSLVDFATVASAPGR